MSTLAEKVIVSAAVEREQRDTLERMARAGERTLSQEIRLAIRKYLAHEGDSEDAS
jgi:hypothetical protein